MTLQFLEDSALLHLTIWIAWTRLRGSVRRPQGFIQPPQKPESFCSKEKALPVGIRLRHAVQRLQTAARRARHQTDFSQFQLDRVRWFQFVGQFKAAPGRLRLVRFPQTARRQQRRCPGRDSFLSLDQSCQIPHRRLGLGDAIQPLVSPKSGA